MTQCNTLNVKLYNSQLNILQSGIKVDTFENNYSANIKLICENSVASNRTTTAIFRKLNCL